jgi:hypothetical protein
MLNIKNNNLKEYFPVMFFFTSEKSRIKLTHIFDYKYVMR